MHRVKLRTFVSSVWEMMDTLGHCTRGARTYSKFELWVDHVDLERFIWPVIIWHLQPRLSSWMANHCQKKTIEYVLECFLAYVVGTSLIFHHVMGTPVKQPVIIDRTYPQDVLENHGKPTPWLTKDNITIDEADEETTDFLQGDCRWIRSLGSASLRLSVGLPADPMPVDWDWIGALPRSILRAGLQYKVRVKLQPCTFPHCLVLMSISWDVTTKSHQPDTIFVWDLGYPSKWPPNRSIWNLRPASLCRPKRWWRLRRSAPCFLWEGLDINPRPFHSNIDGKHGRPRQ